VVGYYDSSPDAILEQLDPEQREVATSLRGPVVVLAGAGTGKTRAITHRIAYGVKAGIYNPGSVMAVTFTARAAGEMRGRLRDLGVGGVRAATFHAAALKQLSYFWPQAIGGPMPEIIEQKSRLIGEAARNINLKVDGVSIRDLAREIEWAKVSLVDPSDYVLKSAEFGRAPISGFTPEQVAALALGYEKIKERRSLIDFEDILAILGGVLAENSPITEMVRNQYRHFVVDEYQDVSPLQQFLLDQWVGDRTSICVVGDPSQTIYSFTGATPKYLLGFKRLYQGSKEIRLVRNYRSTPQVIRIANDILREGKVDGALVLQAQGTGGVEPLFKTYVDDDAEATGIAERAQLLVEKNVPANEIAVLYRTNSQSAAFEQAFSRLGVPYQLKGSMRFFDRSDVRQAISLLSSAIKSEAQGVEMPLLVRQLLSEIGWAENPPAPSGAIRERWDALSALVNLSDQLAARSSISFAATIKDLIDELRERAANQNAPEIDGVTLASIHSAKGLEWRAVFLAGMSEGLMPISLADTPELVAEERRLLYVGLTRAREYLEVSFAKSKTGGRGGRKPSRFLGARFDDRTGRTASSQRNLPAAPTKLNAAASLGASDLALFEKLRSWRIGEAKKLGRPAFTVLSDATLTAIAQDRPSNPSLLVQIPGIGPVKLEQYGDALLTIIREN
jgi:DNA helicase-2/ATP-dependent DNA helicase PcrA